MFNKVTTFVVTIQLGWPPKAGLPLAKGLSLLPSPSLTPLRGCAEAIPLLLATLGRKLPDSTRYDLTTHYCESEFIDV